MGRDNLGAEIIVNPARAGMILVLIGRGLILGRKPRASGDDPSEDFSARVRQT